MKLFIVFMLTMMGLAIWELHGGPRWRMPIVVAGCAALAIAFTSLRVV